MKKNLAVFCTAMIALSATADLWAQTRGANYNPPSRSGSSSSSSSSSSSTPRGSNYNPPTRPSSSSSSSSTSQTPPTRPQTSSSSSSSSSSSNPPRGSNYNPPSSSGSSSSSSSTHTPPTRPQTSSGSSSSSSNPPRGSNYNPPSSSGSSSSGSTYTPPTRPSTSQPSQSGVPRGPRYNPNPSSATTYQPVYHAPRVVEYRTIRYNSYRDYATYVNHRYIYRNWIQEPVIFSYSNGYWMLDNYPYYVHRGFRYRYHPVELCRYQLVDSNNYTAVTSYPVRNCSVAYDQCAVDRDNMNRYQYSDRYFCAENVDYDLANNNDYDWNPYATNVSNSQQYSIENYLYGKSFLDIFYDAQRYGVGSCQIQTTYNSSYYNTEYEVRVGSSSYPEVDGSVNSSTAGWIGCQVGSAEENAGCIMKQAIESGYCL